MRLRLEEWLDYYIKWEMPSPPAYDTTKGFMHSLTKGMTYEVAVFPAALQGSIIIEDK